MCTVTVVVLRVDRVRVCQVNNKELSSFVVKCIMLEGFNADESMSKCFTGSYLIVRVVSVCNCS